MQKDSSKNRRKKRPKEAVQRQRSHPPTQQGRYAPRENVYAMDTAQRQAVVRGTKRGGTISREMQRPERKPRRMRVNRVLPLFVFAAIAIYLVGQMLTMTAKSAEVNVETVGYGGLDTPARYTGLIVRDEYVVKSNRSGQPFYQFSEGEYVSKNAVVCTVKDTGSTNELESKLDQVDKDILKSQKTRSDLSAFSEDITRIEDNIQRTVDTYAGNAMKSDANYLYDMKEQVQSFMTQRNQIWLSENVESLSKLSLEKNQYEQQLAQNMSALTAKESGIVAFSYDGLEETLTSETVGDVKKAQIGENKPKYISKAKYVSEGDPLFKIITSNQWYIVSYLPNSAVVNWAKGETKVMNLQLDDDVIPINAKIAALEAGEKETKVTFSTYQQMTHFLNSRTLEFYLAGAVTEGLKVPNDAIVEKSLITIPKECLQESLGKEGVLLVNGDNAKFIATIVASRDEENYYIEQTGELKLGDVILHGTGETATNFTIATLTPRTGVYVANSSMAKFVTIDILEQNQEYAIIRSGTTYGLQVYDLIVSDAKNIKEGQNLY